MTGRFPDEPAAPDTATCPGCDGIGSWYGIAPHAHDLSGGSFIGSTRIEPRENWPSNFHEDHEAPGCGVWACLVCGGQGEVEKKHGDVSDEEIDPDPWPCDVVELRTSPEKE